MDKGVGGRLADFFALFVEEVAAEGDGEGLESLMFPDYSHTVCTMPGEGWSRHSTYFSDNGV